MSFNPHLLDNLHLLIGVEPENLGTPETLSRLTKFFVGDGLWAMPSSVSVDNVIVHSAEHPVPVRLYHPKVVDAPPLVWLHGGGFVGGNIDMPESHCVAAELAAQARCVVVAVDYRLASETVRYPAPVDDVVAVWRWLSEDQSAAGTPAIGGASAGAALALSTALRARDEGLVEPRALLLAYPFAHFPTPALPWDIAEEMKVLPPFLRFTPESIAGMVRAYVGRTTCIPAHAMPGAADLSGLAPTTVIVDEYDDLRPSAELLIEQLSDSGVEVDRYLAAGVPHGHLNWSPTIDEVSRSIKVFARALQPIQVDQL